MKIDKLQYQLDAIDNVLSAILPENVTPNENPCANPNLHNTQNIDVKMETGTGKTYVYTRLMHELKRQFGFFKFILLVPSLPIKEGTKMSILSDDWNKHFFQKFNNQSITLGVINAGDFNTKRGKRKQIPEPLRSFCDSTRAEENNIQVLLINDAMLASVSMTSNYDSTLFGSISRPLDGLKSTRPIVIIDEPHRFNKENKAWENITKGLKPQLIVRFGATFPEITIGKGKLKETKKDYENLVYNLNSVRAFNEGLVKSVHIVYPALNNADAKKYKITNVEKGKCITINGKEIKVFENLSPIDLNFGNLTLEYESGNATKLKLSNELAIENGLELTPDIFGNDYQALMLSQALDAHFEKEKENFFRPNKGKIKTNSLFFIESVSSFRKRNEEGEKKGWLREKFEELLRKKLENEMANTNGEYKQFLEYSLQNVSSCLAGYFAEDNQTTGDDKEKIQNEVDNILRNKEQSLTFKDKNGNWNICRFFFSKWTLCEGWDNPNVFVIAKLRSSGSENRKIQEVGRGLRLPFDENGNRISNEDFYLTYIIDYSEREFARKLVSEINADGGELQTGKITEHILELLVKAEYAPTIAKAKGKLLLDDVIDDKDKILDAEKLFTLLPEDSGLKVKAGKITGEGLPEKPKVKLNRENFNKLKTLWEQVTKRYLLRFEEIGETRLKEILCEVLAEENMFVEPTVQIIEDILIKGDNLVKMIPSGYKSVKSDLGKIPYGEFLKRLNKQTNLPIPLLHESIIYARKGKETPQGLFNIILLNNIIKAFEKKFEEVFAQKFSYHALDFKASTSILSNNGEFKEFLPQGDVGVNEAKDLEKIRPDKATYLYDKYLYDSEIEHEVLRVQPPEKIIVYGKLPRRSIKLPTYTGGTTSPDFVYALKNNDSDDIKLHLIVETKSENMRFSDKVAIEAQQKAFAKIGGNIEWKMETDVTVFERDLREMAKGS
jgi:type III restriction enzyme